MKLDLIAGARPNFVKIAPIIHSILESNSIGKQINFRLIHTGQHYDNNMSGSFFKQLDIPKPHINLGAGGGTQAEQTSAIMLGYEKLILKNKPNLCLVVGDVTSTMACAIVAQKQNVNVAHVEAGIRSGDWRMPEEINRLVTDSISNFFFTTTPKASKTILNTGVSEDRVFWVGNTMIDTLLSFKSKFKKPYFWDKLKLTKKKYIIMTLHRPSNVDEEKKLKSFIDEIIENSNGLPLIFPVHPRTMKVLDKLGIDNKLLHKVDPLGYLEFNFLVNNSLAVITDSGGITEETTVLGIPCMTLRDSTERPETVIMGTNELLGVDPNSIKPAMIKLFNGDWKKGKIPKLWDGKTSKRIVSILNKLNIGN